MKPDLEKDLLNNENIVAKCKNSQIYSQNLYAALCNNIFSFGEDTWSCSWRYAGGIVSEINGGNDYMDFYCSGIAADYKNGYVSESVVTEEIRFDLSVLGWKVMEQEHENI